MKVNMHFVSFFQINSPYFKIFIILPILQMFMILSHVMILIISHRTSQI